MVVTKDIVVVAVAAAVHSFVEVQPSRVQHCLDVHS